MKPDANNPLDRFFLTCRNNSKAYNVCFFIQAKSLAKRDH